MKGIPRPIEAVLAGAGLLMVLPLMTIVAVLIKTTAPGPALFVQKRMGRHGKAFTLYKFRSMRVDNIGIQVTSDNDSRITPIGKVIRKTKLDELPELFNVVKGDLSLVGPRPEVVNYVDLNNPLWREILEARPGITDPVTLKLRNEEELMGRQSNPEAFYLETLQPWKLRGYANYLSRRSVTSDLRIILATVIAVLVPSRTPPPPLEENGSW